MARYFIRIVILLLLVIAGQTKNACANDLLDFDRIDEIPERKLVNPLRSHAAPASIFEPPCRFLNRHLAIDGETSLNKFNNQLRSSRTASVSNHIPDESADESANRATDDRWFSCLKAIITPGCRAYELLESESIELGQFVQRTLQRTAYRAIVSRANEFGNRVAKLRLSDLAPQSATPVNVEKSVDPPQSTPAEKGTDRYWQYYEDCDQWDVIFALTGQRSYLQTSLLMVPRANLLQYDIDGLVQGAISRDLLMLVGTGKQFVTRLKVEIETQIRLEEFRLVETADINWELLEPGIHHSNPVLLNDVQADINRCGWLMEKIRAKLSRQLESLHTQTADWWTNSVSPMIVRANLQKSRFDLALARRQNQFERITAKNIGWIGQRLVGLSESLLDEVEERECELDYQAGSLNPSRLAEGKSGNKLN